METLPDNKITRGYIYVEVVLATTVGILGAVPFLLAGGDVANLVVIVGFTAIATVIVSCLAAQICSNKKPRRFGFALKVAIPLVIAAPLCGALTNFAIHQIIDTTIWCNLLFLTTLSALIALGAAASYAFTDQLNRHKYWLNRGGLALIALGAPYLILNLIPYNIGDWSLYTLYLAEAGQNGTYCYIFCGLIITYLAVTFAVRAIAHRDHRPPAESLVGDVAPRSATAITAGSLALLMFTNINTFPLASIPMAVALYLSHSLGRWKHTRFAELAQHLSQLCLVLYLILLALWAKLVMFP